MTGSTARKRTPVLNALLVLCLVVVLAGAGVLGLHWWREQGPSPSGATDDGGVAFGPVTASTVVDLYLDPVCPSCRALVAREESQVDALLATGARVRYHVVGFLDGESRDSRPTDGVPGSLRRDAGIRACGIDCAVRAGVAVHGRKGGGSVDELSK